MVLNQNGKILSCATIVYSMRHARLSSDLYEHFMFLRYCTVSILVSHLHDHSHLWQTLLPRTPHYSSSSFPSRAVRVSVAFSASTWTDPSIRGEAFLGPNVPLVYTAVTPPPLTIPQH
jgi:hypothetical protein